MKHCVKETAPDLDMNATFLSNPWGSVQSGGHLNFSLWKDGLNIFSDPGDPDGLSETAKNFLAGLLNNAPAITALICPTNNCYDRFYDGGFAPNNLSYGTENRSCCVRVKHSPSSGTYMEFRSPGAAANPYLVMAGVLAAGLDGLRNKIQVSLFNF